MLFRLRRPIIRFSMVCLGVLIVLLDTGFSLLYVCHIKEFIINTGD